MIRTYSSLRHFTSKLCFAFVLIFSLTHCHLTQAQTYTVLYSFTGGADGAAPTGGLIMDSSGNLYGTTYGWDGYHFAGTTAGSVFEISSGGVFTLLHNFGAGGTGGAWPWAGLVQNNSGDLYGTTLGGGTTGAGTVFKLDSAGNFAALYSFAGGRDGAGPAAPMILDSAGVLYGTTFDGGNPKCRPYGWHPPCGTVFEFFTAGKRAGKEKILHRFSSAQKYGDLPRAPLLRTADGNLFGTAAGGGPGVVGTVFKLAPTGTMSLFHAFYVDSGGWNPFSGLVQDAAGNFYGTTVSGGNVYKLDPQGNETVLFQFYGTRGEDPYSGVIMDAAGNLYGTTYAGGNQNVCLNDDPQGCGVVYKLDPFGNETVLYEFSGGTDGANPTSGVIMDSAGNLYGTAVYGGIVNSACPSGCGVVFKITP